MKILRVLLFIVFKIVAILMLFLGMFLYFPYMWITKHDIFYSKYYIDVLDWMECIINSLRIKK